MTMLSTLSRPTVAVLVDVLPASNTLSKVTNPSEALFVIVISSKLPLAVRVIPLPATNERLSPTTLASSVTLSGFNRIRLKVSMVATGILFFSVFVFILYNFKLFGQIIQRAITNHG